MTSRSGDRDRMIFILALFSLLAACAAPPRVYLQYGSDLRRNDVDSLLAANPLAPGQNIGVTTLGREPAGSHHLVQIRDREVPHVHKRHDANVTMLKGHGYLMLGKQRIDLAAGDVVYIPRGVVHAFINTGGEPAVAFAIYTPAFDGKDTYPVSVP